MIVSCPECSTHFNVDAERIAASGSKVRCARCKHIFLVHRPQPQPLDVDLPAEQPSFEPEPELPSFELEPELPSFELEPETEDMPGFLRSLPDDLPETTDIETVDFDYDRFQELDAIGHQNGSHHNGSHQNENDEEPSEQERLSSSDEEIARTDSLPPAMDHDPPTDDEPSSEGGGFALAIKLVLLLLLALIIIGGILVSLHGPERVNQLFRDTFRRQPVTVPAGQISLGAVEGSFLTNAQAGELFIIRGVTVNDFAEPRSAIQVKGVLYDQHGKPLMQKTVFCGNPISDEELRSLPFSDFEQRMSNQFGKDLSNMRIAPGRNIPFIIVFRDLPKDMDEFSVTVTSSSPATQ